MHMLSIFQVANLTIKIKIDHLNLSKWVELDNEIENLEEVFTSNLYFPNTKIIYLYRAGHSVFRFGFGFFFRFFRFSVLVQRVPNTEPK